MYVKKVIITFEVTSFHFIREKCHIMLNSKAYPYSFILVGLFLFGKNNSFPKSATNHTSEGSYGAERELRENLNHYATERR